MQIINAPDGTKIEIATRNSLIERVNAVWDEKFVPFYLEDKRRFPGFEGWDDIRIGLNPYALVEAGKVNLLLLLKQEPLAAYPNVPILKDFNYDFPFPTVLNVVGPKALPDGIANKLETAFTKAIKEPGFTKGMNELRLPIVYRNSKDFAAYVARDHARFGKILKERGLIK